MQRREDAQMFYQIKTGLIGEILVDYLIPIYEQKIHFLRSLRPTIAPPIP